MNFEEYYAHHKMVVSNKITEPASDAELWQYTQLNLHRTERWLKTYQCSTETVQIIKAINKPQQWIVITEPWCGDAAHIVPIIARMSELNTLITLQLQLRDSGSEIEKYLTNGTRSIPKLIVRNSAGADLLSWGPRPEAAQKIYQHQKSIGADWPQVATALQQWYNADKGRTIELEISRLLQNDKG